MYSSIDDLKKIIPEQKLIQLTDDENLGTINQDRITEAIKDADSEIDTYCEKLYEVPFSPVPQIIKKLSVDITAFNAYSRRPEVVEIPETINARYVNAISLLRRIADGTVSIGNLQQSAPEDSKGEVLTAGGQVFTRDSLKGF
ncbi:MAG: DUF1320 domain-containing protein [bacterium]